MKRFDRLDRRDLRLASGLVMFTYLSLHLINHALGLVSLAVAETGLRAVVAIWHSVPGTVLLYGAAAIHVGLAMLALFERCTLRMPGAQALRIVLGLWMPVVLITHFTGTRLAFERYGESSDYTRVVTALWSPEGGGRQLALLVPGWIHGCLGLRFAFGGKPWFRRGWPVLFGAALLLPVLAALGFLAMGRELGQLAAASNLPAALPLHGEPQTALALFRDRLLGGYLGVVALVLLGRQVRRWIELQRKALVAISYPGRTVRVPRGWSVLEASRGFGIPHLSLCGGNARCSTCRVQVTSGAQHCPAPSRIEQQLLARMRAGDDVRLACQLRPRTDLTVVPLAMPPVSILQGPATPPATAERTVAILIAELRRSADSMSDHRSAHDKLYALNLFYDGFADAVIAAGGVPCGFSGDAAMGVFGIQAAPNIASHQLLRAIELVDAAVRRLNQRLAVELALLGDLVLVAHAGSAVVGPMGYRAARTLAAVGPAVDGAQRLREYARAHRRGCVISQSVFDLAGSNPGGAPVQVDPPEGGGPGLRAYGSATAAACLDAVRGAEAADSV